MRRLFNLGWVTSSRQSLVFQSKLDASLDAGDDHFQCYGIEPAFRDDNIGIAFRRLNKFQVHGADSIQILLDNRIAGTASFSNIALQPANEADVRICIYKDFYIKQGTQLHFGKY